MITNISVNFPKADKPVLTIKFESQKEFDTFKTLIGYYPYQTMEKLRKEFGNRFPDVTTDEVVSMVESISNKLGIK